MCPNACNNHGTCLRNHTCACVQGFTGADCSLRTCKYDKAWAAKPYDLDSAHSLLECSGNGLCNRRNGLCNCFSGFEGFACERVTCGGNCNDHGACITIGDMYTFYNQNNTFLDYIGWESDKVTACACDLGYTGSNCEIYQCPKGNDPITPYQGFQTINFTTSALWGYISGGSYLFSYNGQSFQFPASAQVFNSSLCQQMFNSLINIRHVECNRTSINNSGGGTYTVKFISFPYLPKDNNIYQNDGILSVNNFSCNVLYTTETSQGLQCSIQDISNSISYPEYAICSNRGICDTSSGICNCYDDFTNSNCDTFKYQPKEISISQIDIMDIISNSITYNKNLVSLTSVETYKLLYNTIRVSDTNGVIFNIDVNGNVDMIQGYLIITGKNNTGGINIYKGGLALSNGITINSKGLVVNSNTYNNTVHGPVQINQGSLYISNGLTISKGEFNVYGGVTIYGSSAKVTGGLTVSAGGLSITRGGLYVNDGVTIRYGGLYVNGKGITVHSVGMYISGGISVNGINSGSTFKGMTITNGGLYCSGSLTIGNNGLFVNKLTILSNLYLTTGGLSVTNGGIILSDGIVENNLGLFISNGLTITNNDLHILLGGLYMFRGLTVSSNVAITGGISILAGGLKVTGGASVSNGLSISSPGSMSVYTGGLFVSTAGMSVQTLGIYSDATIAQSGIFITGGLSIISGGMYVSSYLTATNGINVYNGVTVQNGFASKPLLIASGGMQSTGGVSVNAGGISIGSGGMSILSNGISATGSITIQSPNSLNVENGLTILSGGFDYENVGSTMSVSGGSVIVTTGLSINQNSLSTIGLYITNGLTIGSGGLTVPYPNTVVGIPLFMVPHTNVYVSGVVTLNYFTKFSSGMTVYGAGLRFTRFVTIPSGGLVIQGTLNYVIGGLYSQDGLSINSKGLYISGGVSIESGDFAVYNGLTVPVGGMTIANGLTISSLGYHLTSNLQVIGGITINNGLKINSNGLNVISGGATISNGLIITGPLTISTNGLTVTGGVLIKSKGLKIFGGLNVDTKGMYVLTNGMSVSSGVSITGGMSVISGNMYIENTGMSVESNGMFISRGLSILTSGLVAPSMSVLSNGLAISNGLSINNGLYVDGDFSSSNGGIAIYGGATLNSMQVTNGITVATGGLAVLSFDGGLSISNGGLSVLQGGLTMYGHAYWTNGYSISSDKRLKINIENITDSLSKIDQLNGVKYQWKNITNSSTDNTNELLFDDKEYFGLIAQDVKDVIPEVVSTIQDKYLGISYQEIIPLLIEGIHEIYNALQSIEDEDINNNDNVYLNEINDLLMKIELQELQQIQLIHDLSKLID